MMRCPSTLIVAGVDTATPSDAIVASTVVARTSLALGRSGFTVNLVHVLRIFRGDNFFNLEP